jgi:hypothetical protein
MFLLSKDFPLFSGSGHKSGNVRKWLFSALLLIVVIVILALIAVTIHSGLGGAHDRYELG